MAEIDFDGFNRVATRSHRSLLPALTPGGKSPRLNRQMFTTSRLLEFCSQKELVLQTGHPVEQWPLVVLKELIDNALDACEEANVAPQLQVIVRSEPAAFITVVDNAEGIAPETVKSLLDFTVRVSSREAYASPTRGAQGNALKTLIAMPFALNGAVGNTTIQSRGVEHSIRFSVDNLRQTPRIDHFEGASDVRTGTQITVNWPFSASLQLADTKSRFLQIAEDYAWLNRHLRLRIVWDDESQVIEATDPAWRKWSPSDPTSAHWYDAERFERLAAAYVADDQDRVRSRTVRDFIAEFRGMSSSAKQKAALEATGCSRLALADLFTNGSADRTIVTKLFTAIKAVTKSVKPQDLGVIGKEHLAARFEAAGADPESFNYKRILRDDAGIPAVIETAFGYCPDGPPVRRIITGVNWSVGINNPFRHLGQYGDSLDTVLQQACAGREEPIVLVIHLASPRITYTDRGKSGLALGGEITEQDDDQ